MEGYKDDNQKLRYDLIPPIVPEALASILTHGAEKYGDNNWMKGIKFRRVYAALCRHLAAYRRGKWIDDDSGYPHLWCALAELSFLIHYENNLNEYQEFNDFMEEWKRKKEPTKWVIWGKNAQQVIKEFSAGNYAWTNIPRVAKTFYSWWEADNFRGYVSERNCEEVITLEEAKRRLE